MPCETDRPLTQAEREAGFDQQRTGVQRGIRPFTGEPTAENLAEYLNREVFPVLKQARDKINEVYLPVVDNAPSANPLGYYFSEETANADPTTGFIRLDNADVSAATTIRVSQNNGRVADVTPWLEVMSGSVTSPLGVVTISHAVNPNRFARYDLTSMTDQGAYWDLAVTAVEASHTVPLVQGDQVAIQFIPGVSSGTTTVPAGALSPIADDTFLANISGASAAPTAVALTTLAGAGLTGGANAVLAVGAGTNVTVSADAVSVDDFPLTGLADVTGPTLLGLQTGTGPPEELTGAEAGHLIKKAADITISISANQNDWSPAGFATCDHLFVNTSGGDYTITGFDSSVFDELEGTEFVIYLTSTGSLTFPNNSGSSSAGNLLQTPIVAGSTFRISQNEAVKWRYVNGIWRALPHAPLLTGQLMGNRLQRGNVITATLSGTTHNWSPTNLLTADTIEITLTGNSTLTGLDSTVFNVGGATASGREIIIHNVDSTDTLTLPTNSGSLSGNCFHSRGPNRSTVLGPGQAALVRKEGSFWIPRVLDGAMSDDTVLVNISGALSNAQPRALSSMVAGGITYDATNHTWEWDATTPLIPDGDKGHIVVSASGATWLWDTAIAITGNQSIATTGDLLLLGEGGIVVESTAVPTVGAATGNVIIKADADLLATTAGVNISAGHTASGADLNDIALNAAGGVLIRASATPATGATDGNVRIACDATFDLDAGTSVLLTAATGSVTVVATAGDVALTAGDDIVVNPADDLVLQTASTTRVRINAAGDWDFENGLDFDVTGSVTIDTIGAGTDITLTAVDDATLTGNDAFVTGAAQAVVRATAGNAVVAASSDVRIETNSVTRLSVEEDGSWELAGDTGDALDVLTSTGSSTPPLWSVLTTIRQNYLRTGVISPTVAADTSDWNPTGLSTASVIRLTVTGTTREIDGIVAQPAGTIITIINISTVSVTFTPAAVSSSAAANQIEIQGDGKGLTQHGVITFWYDGTSSKWRVLSCCGEFNVSG